MASVTDTFGETESEPVVVHVVNGGEFYRLVLDDGSSWLFDGPELDAAMEHRREIREQAA